MADIKRLVSTQTEVDGVSLGLYDDTLEVDYHRGPGIGSSGLVTIGDHSPGHFQYQRLNPTPPTEAMQEGSAFHCAVLRPDDFDHEFVEDTGDNRNSNKWKEWAAKQHERGLTIIRRPAYANLFNMVEAVRKHSRASILCNPDDIHAEVSGYWNDPQTGVLCKMRADAINVAHDVLVDVKKSVDASLTAFAKTIADRSYYIQETHYTEGMFRIGWPMKEFIFVVVEPKPPYGINCLHTLPTTKQFALTRWRRLLDRYAECVKANEWPLYPEEIRGVDMPQWGFRGKVG